MSTIQNQNQVQLHFAQAFNDVWLVNELNNENSSNNSNSFASVLKDPSFVEFFKDLHKGIIENLDVKINNKIAKEFDKHLGINKELTSDRVGRIAMRRLV